MKGFPGMGDLGLRAGVKAPRPLAGYNPYLSQFSPLWAAGQRFVFNACKMDYQDIEN